MYLFVGEVQETSETYKRCWILVLEMTQEIVDDEIEVDFCRSMILIDWKHMQTFEGRYREKFKTLSSCLFDVL